jgi:hypothetical protein
VKPAGRLDGGSRFIPKGARLAASAVAVMLFIHGRKKILIKISTTHSEVEKLLPRKGFSRNQTFA